MTVITALNNRVSDIQFVKNFDEDMGISYEEAKSSYVDAPLQTLTLLRSIVEEYCKQLIAEHNIGRPDALASMITLLNKKR